MGDDRLYTIEEIRLAFWENFHESGEQWFPYQAMGASAEECEGATHGYWDAFAESLNSMKQANERETCGLPNCRSCSCDMRQPKAFEVCHCFPSPEVTPCPTCRLPVCEGSQP